MPIFSVHPEVLMLISRPYERQRALLYAERWALDRNPLFENFTGRGGDCTNLVSQCIFAGCCTMNFTPDFGWYYVSADDRAPAWSGVEFFYDFLTGAPDFAAVNGGVGPYGREVRPRQLEPGDVVQLADAAGDFYHTLFCTALRGGDILVAAHSDDAYDRPLSSYNYASARFLHIDGIRVELPDGCFDALYSGTELVVGS